MIVCVCVNKKFCVFGNIILYVNVCMHISPFLTLIINMIDILSETKVIVCHTSTFAKAIPFTQFPLPVLLIHTHMKNVYMYMVSYSPLLLELAHSKLSSGTNHPSLSPFIMQKQILKLSHNSGFGKIR